MTKEKTDTESMQDASKENDAAAAKAAQQKSTSTDGDPAKEASAAEADAAAARTRQAQADADAQARADAETRARASTAGMRPTSDPAARNRPAIKQQTHVAVTPGLDNPEGVLQQHDQVQQENERRNERNREGHERNMQLEENRAAEAQARTERFEDPRAGHVPTGRQRDVNTPEILADGTKVWR